MGSLSELPEIVGFFSYSREDDQDSHGTLSGLRTRIQGELRGQLGRTARTFRLWQDKEAIPSGTLWEGEIKTAVAQAVFFIPIITPTVVASPYCKFELESFLAREAELGRSDLVFPILYIEVPELEDAARRQNDPVLSLIAKRQYVDWREFRHLDFNSTEVKRAIERFCAHIRDAMRRTWISPEEKAAALAVAETGRIEAERREAEVRQAAEVQARQRAAEDKRRSEAEAEERRRQAAEAERRNEEEAQRRRDAAEAKRRAGEDQGRRAAPLPPPPVSRVPQRGLLIGSLVGVVLLGVIGAWLFLSPSPAPAPVTPTPAPVTPTPAPAAPAPATASSNPSACGPDDTDCLISKACGLFPDKKDMCSYTPVCTAALRAAAQRGVSDFNGYLNESVEFNAYTPYVKRPCSVTFYGPKSDSLFHKCAGDCLTIDYTWSGDIDYPSVQITDIKKH